MENHVSSFFVVVVVVVVVAAISWAAPTAYGGSQARGRIGAVAAKPTQGPQQRRIRAASATYTTAHGNAGSLTPEQGQGLNPQPHGS